MLKLIKLFESKEKKLLDEVDELSSKICSLEENNKSLQFEMSTLKRDKRNKVVYSAKEENKVKQTKPAIYIYDREGLYLYIFQC